MEQQTVSIAKAGITTTLNARTSVLAAANPLYSRWNKRKSMSDNINLPNSLISRFDLIFLILDTPSEENDLKLAKHVCHVHTHACPPTLDFEPYDPAFLKYYIAQAREHDDPVVPEALTEYIVTQYVSMRSQQANLAANDQTVMTARQLLSILRLAQSLARLRFAEEVDSNDIDEAIRLIHVSKASLADDEDGPGGAGGANASGDAVTRVYRCIRDYAAAAGVMSLEYAFVADMVTKKGFTAVDLQRCIDEYTELNVIQVDQEMTKIDFVE
jgi:DNA replication licensing factor MCM7